MQRTNTGYGIPDTGHRFSVSGLRYPVFILAALLLCAPLRAQQQQTPGVELIDRVVAVVGTQPILLSEVNERIQQARAQGMQVPEDTTAILAIQRQFLQQIVDDEVLYQQA